MATLPSTPNHRSKLGFDQWKSLPSLRAFNMLSIICFDSRGSLIHPFNHSEDSFLSYANFNGARTSIVSFFELHSRTVCRVAGCFSFRYILFISSTSTRTALEHPESRQSPQSKKKKRDNVVCPIRYLNTDHLIALPFPF